MSTVNPEMITLARELREQTQTALSEALGITQATLSKVENGQIEASSELIERLSSCLEFPPAFFSQELAINELPGSFFRRRLTQVPQKTIKAVRGRWGIVLRGVATLLAPVDFPSSRLPNLDLKMLGIGAGEAAKRLRAEWSIPVGPIANVTALVESMGVLVVPFDFGTERIDGMSVHDVRTGSPPTIFVNNKIPGDRQRFTTVHELAHLCLHCHLASTDKDEDLEHEADVFASEFLLPSEQVRGHLVGLDIGALYRLKAYWRVSMASLLMKADQLHLITERKRNILWAQFSKRGWKTCEPNPLPREEATKLKELIELHRDELGYSEQDLCSALCNIGREDLRSLFMGAKPSQLRLVTS
jgi:Zn-dependent peptidase ImmA (M78 family)/transcriptional regulator with XRE-family HTH domain